MRIRFNSLKTRLIITMLLMVVLPTITIGWVVHNRISEYIRSDRISDVGRVADAKHEQLVMVLTRANSRAELFLSSLNKQCGGNSVRLNHICATRLIDAYLAAEGAIGANIRMKWGSLTIGTSAVQHEENIAFKTGQLAKFSGTGPNNNRSYFISVAEKLTGLQLSITYPSSVLEPVFNPYPADLGLSGETFLVDGEGYFVTSPRYASTQGHKHPISARPMQSCLGGQSHAVLDLDYRDVAVIHGYRFIPEFGSACIMAHITQDEAFAPLKLLEQRLIFAILLFCIILIITIFYLARNIVKPITNLTKVARVIAEGDYKAQADVTGSNEISELAASFNFMTNQLVQSEKTLSKAQQLAQRFGYLLQNSFNEIYLLDASTLCFVQVSEGAKKNLGYSADELNQLTPLNLEPLFTRESFERMIAPLRSGEQQSLLFETVHRRKDGTTYPVEIRLQLMPGDSPVFLAIVQDITERKLMEEGMQRSETKFRTIYESSSDAIMLLGEKGFLDCNEAALRVFGCPTHDDFINKHPSRFSPPTQPGGQDSMSLANEHIATAFKNGSNRFEWMHRRLDSTEFPAEVLLTSMELNGRRMLQATVRDITERKQAEEELRKSNSELKEVIRQLHDTQNLLLQSDKMASIGQLAAGVAHEINNPIGYVGSNLGTLDGYLKNLFEVVAAYEEVENTVADSAALARVKAVKNKVDMEFLKEDVQSLLRESQEGIIRVKKIVQDLKDFSRADSGDEWHFANLHQGLDSTLNVASNEIKYKADVKKEYGDIPDVECLPSQLNQVFMNLLVNAAHTIEGRGAITLRTGQQGNEVWVEVADTGKGIAPEHINKIFDPFFTTKPVGKGTGLGLSLSYGIIQKHHGRIEVKSEVGKGASFKVWLPVNQPQRGLSLNVVAL